MRRVQFRRGKILPDARLQPTSMVFGAALVGLLLAACSADPGPGSPLPDVADTSSDGGDLEGISCLATEGCNAEPGYAGTLCISGICQLCLDDASCEADYGVGSVCQSGRCSEGCTPGQPDCICDDGACEESFCIVGECEVCTPGETGCVCSDGESCGEGDTCNDGLCETCSGAELGCACNSDDTCEPGLRCAQGDTCELCPAGEQGCPCESGNCDDDLVCMSDICAAEGCLAGALDCPCDDGGCEDGAYCASDSQCRACDANGLGCDCDTEEGCEGDFVCDEDDSVCRVELTCEDDAEDALGCLTQQLCDDREDGEDAVCLPSCQQGYRWTGTTCEQIPPATCTQGVSGSIALDCSDEHRTCVAGDPEASCGTCLSGYLEETGNCRAVVTCADLNATCGELNRSCVEGGASTDAQCGDCQVPFVPAEGGDQCVVSQDANCGDGNDDDLAPVCDGQYRECVELTGGGAECGGCKDGFAQTLSGECAEISTCVELGCEGLGRQCVGQQPFQACGECEEGLVSVNPDDPMAACRTRLRCEDLACDEELFCLESELGGDATCVSGSCDPGQAFDRGTSMCVTCAISAADCTEPGHTGRLWPFSREGGECVCETAPGYYFDTSSALIPRPCDADSDGWIVTGARPFLEHSDDAVRENARCNLRTIDRVTLQNDLLQRVDVLLCQEGPQLANHGACDEVAPLALYESATLDDDDAIHAAPGFFPRYQNSHGDGVVPSAGELNPLTRGCVTAGGDYNNNGFPDIQEAQEMDTGALGLTATEARLFAFAFYLELHTSWVESRPTGDYDRYVIAERSRCSSESDGFALGYDEPGEYWRECLRRRVADYDSDFPTPGYDFATW
ncbi:MAG: hypothetical protein KC561_00845 [Myxococcales bacterium]|nr:hypothetical protein [Myxococcales bacterium]